MLKVLLMFLLDFQITSNIFNIEELKLFKDFLWDGNVWMSMIKDIGLFLEVTNLKHLLLGYLFDI